MSKTDKTGRVKYWKAKEVQIMPMERERYPADWKQIANRVKDEVGWICQFCGKQCRRPGEPFTTHRNTLTVAHIDHIPEHMARENLLALCAPCHLRYDAKQHAESRRKRAAKHRQNDGKDKEGKP